MKMQAAMAAQKHRTINYNFLSGSLPSGITYTGGNGSYYNSSGIVTAATTNVARFDYNPNTLIINGAMQENARTNVLKSSMAVGDGNWTIVLGFVTATTNSATAPDGTSTATLLTNVGASQPYLFQTTGVTTAGNYAASLFVKQGTNGTVMLSISDQTANAGTAVFKFSDQTFTTSIVGNATSVTGTSETLPNGWFRIKVIFAFSGAGAVNFAYTMGVWNDTAGNATIGNTALVWGAQCENAQAFCSSFIPTTAAVVTRTVDLYKNSSVSSWFNATKGTFITQAKIYGSNASTLQQAAEFSDGTANNRMYQYINVSAGSFDESIVVSGSGATANTAGTPTLNTTFKLGLSYISGANVGCYDGNLFAGAGFIASAIPAGITTLTLGNRADSIRSIDGWLQQFRYWNYNVSSAQLVSLTR